MSGDPEHSPPLPATASHFPSRLPRAGGLARSPNFPCWGGGGGEALEAQDPAGETDKADACAADAEMAQDPIDEADDADVGAIDAEMDADYVADVTSAQGAWDPWPTQDRVAGLGLYLLPLHYRHFIFIMVL